MSNAAHSYPVALERDIQPYSLARSRLGGVDLVLWRARSGNIHVWEDRCPHRSIRLSAGRNLGDFVEGVYHGWRFGEDGLVCCVPAENGRDHPEISVKVIASVVSGGMVWASLDGAPVPDPDIAGQMLRPIHIKAPAAVVSEELARHQISPRYWVTPWADNDALVFAVADTEQHVRRLNLQLVAARNHIEGTAR